MSNYARARDAVNEWILTLRPQVEMILSSSDKERLIAIVEAAYNSHPIATRESTTVLSQAEIDALMPVGLKKPAPPPMIVSHGGRSMGGVEHPMGAPCKICDAAPKEQPGECVPSADGLLPALPPAPKLPPENI